MFGFRCVWLVVLALVWWVPQRGALALQQRPICAQFGRGMQSTVMRVTPYEGGRDDALFKGTRKDIVGLVEETWRKVNVLVPQETMASCEQDLHTATTMLVLEIVRKSAGDSLESRTMVESMFRAADVNNDGSLTFSEWYDWLNLNQAMPSSSSSDEDSDSGASSRGAMDGEDDGQAMMGDAKVWSGRFQEGSMIDSLSKVVSQAVCALKVANRLEFSTPTLLTPSFIAGGLMSGEIDPEFARAMTDRLPVEVMR